MNEQAKFINTDAIPNFKELGFKHSPIVRHVALDQFYKQIATLQGNANQPKIGEYKYDVTQAAIEQYGSLNEAIQQRVAIAAFHYLDDEMKKIEKAMIALQKRPGENWEHQPLEKLTQTFDKLVALEKLYVKNIGLSYLDFDLDHLQTLLRSGKDEVHIQDNQGVTTLVLSKDKSAQLAQIPLLGVLVRNTESAAPSLANDNGFVQQRFNYVGQLSSQLGQKTVQLAGKYAEIALVSATSTITKENYQDCNQYRSLMDVISRDISSINLSAHSNSNIADLHHDLLRLKLILTELKNCAQTAKSLDKLISAPDVAYDTKLTELTTRVNENIKALEQNPQYKAMVFLEGAERYIHSPERQWNTGYQWTKHTLEGKNIAIPKHVARQLEEIKAAKADGNYEHHMENFVAIGQKEANSFFRLFSSQSSKRYSAFFAGVDRAKTVERLNEEFKPKSPRH